MTAFQEITAGVTIQLDATGSATLILGHWSGLIGGLELDPQSSSSMDVAIKNARGVDVLGNHAKGIVGPTLLREQDLGGIFVDSKLTLEISGGDPSVPVKAVPIIVSDCLG